MTAQDAVAHLESLSLPSLTAEDLGIGPRGLKASNRAREKQLERLAGEVEEALDAVAFVAADRSTPDAERARAATAYFRCAAFVSRALNVLTEAQKSYWVRRVKPARAQAIVVDAWSASEDPHAALVRELRGALPDLALDEVVRLVEAVCGDWTLATPWDESDYSPSPKAIRNKVTALIGSHPKAVGAVARWLDTLAPDDVERRVLHAGVVLAGGEKEAQSRQDRQAVARRGVDETPAMRISA